MRLQLRSVSTRSILLLLLAPAAITIAEKEGDTKLSFSSLSDVADLCSPRKISVYKKHLFVAESGIGLYPTPANVVIGVTPNCVGGNFGVIACIAQTSRVSSYKLSKKDGGTKKSIRTTVVDQLFSTRPLAGQSETHATGAQSICFDDTNDGTWYLVTGLGLDGDTLKEDDIDETVGAFGSVLRFAPGQTDPSDGLVVAIPWEDEFANNYDGSTDPTGVLPVPNSNPYDIACVGDNYYVVR
jgi:hypothetical protein